VLGGLLAVAIVALAYGAWHRASHSAIAASMTLGGAIAVSPQPDTPDASPVTQISFLGVPATQLGAVSVVGSSSGRHAGSLKPYSTGDGASFLADRGFTAGEHVHVHMDPKPGGISTPLDFSFRIARPGSLIAPILHPPPVAHTDLRQRFLSSPALTPPRVSITRDSAGSTPGDVFLSPLSTSPQGGSAAPQHGPMILDPRGNMVWFHSLPQHTAAMNFRPQLYRGAPVLSWWQGHVDPLGFGRGEDIIMDSSYREIAHVGGGNGYQPDLHELVITPQGTAWFTAYSPVQVNLTRIHGPRDGTVLDSIIQEVDVKTGLVMYEWHSIGHVSVRDTYAEVAGRAALDFSHLNSIELHGDKMVLCARNTWAVYEVSIATGKILWTLGGKRSSFRLGPGVQFAYQHDAQLHPDGTLTLFDDEATPEVRHLSRGLVIKLDFQAHKATVLHEYTHPQDELLSGSQGNMQILPNGDAFVGWGPEPYFSEYSPAGELVYDGHFPRPVGSYRAYRFPWIGWPSDKPSVAARNESEGKLSVFASWNGATQVASWQVLAGASTSALRPVGRASSRAGFETRIRVATREHYVAVRALDFTGNNLGTSAAVKV
jgi:hypothetical protein